MLGIMLEAFVAALSTCAIASLTLLLVTHVAVHRVRARVPGSAHKLPISVLKPLKGLHPGLWQNLVAFARQDYSDFELVFGCADPSDPAVALVRALQRDFPRVCIRLVTGAPDVGMNPKVDNLRQIERAARHDVLLISDADTRPGPDYLARMIGELEPDDVGLVCSAFSGQGERDLGAALENLHLTAFVTSNVCGSETLAGQPIVVGKSMLFQRDVLRQIGGWDAVGDVLAEDYAFGAAVRTLGLRVVLSSYILPVINVRRSLADFWARHVRWGQMRRHIIPRLYFAEPLLMPTVWLGALWLTSGGPAGPPSAGLSLAWSLALAGLGVRVLADWLLVRAVRGRAMRPSALLLPLLKDVLSLAVWLVAALRTTVAWRGTVLRIGPGSALYPLDAPLELPARVTE